MTNTAARTFGMPPRGPVYTPKSEFGDATICDLPVMPAPTCRRKPRARLLTRRGWTAVAIIVVALTAVAGVPIWNAWSDHARACALPVHSQPCGDQK